MLLLTFAAIGLAAGSVWADTKITARDLPPDVQKAIPAAARGATITGYARTVDGGQLMFEVETTSNGHARNLLFDITGRLVQVQQAVALNEIPATLRLVLEARGHVVAVEQITRGATVTYEATVEQSGRKSQIKADADGKLIKP
jgi:hypothetical protein